MADKSITYRFGVAGDKQVVQALTEIGTAADQATRKVGESGERIGESTERWSKKQQAALQRLVELADPAQRAQRRMANSTDLFDAALRTGNVSAQDHARYLGLLRTRYEEGARGSALFRTATAEATQAAAGMASRLGPVGVGLMALGPAGLAAAAGIGVLIAVQARAVTLAAESERVHLRMTGVLKATGHAAGLTAAQLSELADEIKDTTLFDDDQAKAASAALLTFRSVSGDTFREAIKLSADLAAVFGGDLTANAVRLGRALEDPVEGVSALRRVGVMFSAEQETLIRKLAETGDKAGAMRVILAEVAKQVGGAAGTENEGTAGAVAGLKKEVEDLLKAMGETKTVNAFANALKGVARAARAGIEGPSADQVRAEAQQQRTRLREMEAAQAGLRSRDPGAAAMLSPEIGDLRRRLAETERLLADLDHEAELEAYGQLQAMHGQAAARRQREGEEATARTKAQDEVLKRLAEEVRLAGLAADQRQETVAAEKARAEILKANPQASAETIKEAEDLARQAVVTARTKAEADKAAGVAEKERTQFIVDMNAAIERGTEAQTKAAEAVIESVDPTFKYAQEVERLNALKPALIKLLGDEAKAQAVLNQAIREADPAYKESQKAAKEIEREQERAFQAMERSAEHATDRVTDAFADMAFSGRGAFEDLKRFALQAFKEIAANAIIRPIVAPVVYGAMGVPMPGAQAGQGGSFSMPGFGGFGGGGFGSSIDAFGAQYLGMADVGPGFVGPLQQGQTAGLTASGALGSALGGFGIGFTGAQLTESKAGGAAIGALGGAAQGFMLGGPPGAAIGALAGIVGGLAGYNKPSNQSAGGTLDLASGQAFAFGNKGDQNVGARDQLLASIGQVAASLQASTGGTLGRSMVGVDVGSRDGTQWWLEQGGEIFRADDPQSALAAITAELARSLTGIPAEVQSAIDKIDWSDLEAGLAKLDIAANYRTMFDPKEAVGPLETAMNALNTEYEAALKIVQELSLEEAALAASRERGAAYLRQGADDANAAAIRAAEGRQYINDVIAQQKAMEVIYKETAAVGGDMTLALNRNHVELREFFRTLDDSQLADVATHFGGAIGDLALAMADVNAQTKALAEAEAARSKALQDQIQEAERAASTWGDMAGSLKSYRLGLLVGDMSPLSPEARLAEARKQFEQTSAGARLGNLADMGNLQGVSQALLDASRAYFGSGAGYVEDFGKIQDALASTETVAERHARIAQQQLETLNDQLAEAQRQTDLLASLGGTSSASTSASTSAGGSVTSGPPVATHDLSTDAGRVTALYRMGLDREPDAAGLAYWTQQAASTPWATLKNQFFTAAEMNDEASVHRFATGGSFRVDGPAGNDNLFLPQMRVQRGEMVSVTRGDSMKEVADLLRRLVDIQERQLGVSATSGASTVERLAKVVHVLEDRAGQQALAAARAR